MQGHNLGAKVPPRKPQNGFPMHKYLATIFGVAIGIATAVVVAAHAEDNTATHRSGPAQREGGA